LRVAHKKEDVRNRWAVEVRARRGENIACVALANKQARTVWLCWLGVKATKE